MNWQTGWQIGDVVELMSGSPPMTVTFVETYAGGVRCWCEWFDGTDAKKAHYPPDALQKAEPKTAG